MEEWKDVKGYEGRYQVSNKGRVKSLNYKRQGSESILKPHAATCGYLTVNLRVSGKTKILYVHRLVAEAFIPNPNGHKVVHHIDENTHNNKISNLIWMDEGEHHSMHTTRNLSKRVCQYTLDGELVKIWNSTAECGRNGYSDTHISRCCNGKRKTHKGFKWVYE